MAWRWSSFSSQIEVDISCVVESSPTNNTAATHRTASSIVRGWLVVYRKQMELLFRQWSHNDSTHVFGLDRERIKILTSDLHCVYCRDKSAENWGMRNMTCQRRMPRWYVYVSASAVSWSWSREVNPTSKFYKCSESQLSHEPKLGSPSTTSSVCHTQPYSNPCFVLRGHFFPPALEQVIPITLVLQRDYGSVPENSIIIVMV